ncbi:hypothetical protein D3C81_2041160 [compost metagenome]
MRDQHGVLGLDDHQILDANGSHQAAVGMHIGVAGVLAQHVALEDVALGILSADVPQC